MITFLVCLAALVVAYFTYGRYLEKMCGIDAANPVPSQTMYDGVDYIPMPRWKVFLIQLLNIAGLGPIFGALLGAAYGPVAFLWITLGGIFMGAMHDFVSGVISLKEGGKSLPEIIGKYLGDGTRTFMRIFSVFLMVLVGAVFMSQPAELIASNIAIPSLEIPAFSSMSWELVTVLAVILVYLLLGKDNEQVTGGHGLKIKWWHYLIFFIIGFYGGYIYIGLGFLILALAIWTMKLDIITANVIKGFVIFLSTPFALAVFIYNGQVEWMAGLLHGVGNILGAVMASHWAMSWGVKFVRWFTLFIIVVFFIDLMGWISLQSLLEGLL